MRAGPETSMKKPRPENGPRSGPPPGGPNLPPPPAHFFRGGASENRAGAPVWVFGVCGFWMVAELVGGCLSRSLALAAGGLPLSTSGGALFLPAPPYPSPRRHADDRRFTFGT